MRAKCIVSAVLVAGLIWAIAVVVGARRQAAQRNALEAAKAQRAAELARQVKTVPIPVEIPAVTPAPEPPPPVVENRLAFNRLPQL